MKSHRMLIPLLTACLVLAAHPALADISDIPAEGQLSDKTEVSLGYRGVSQDGTANRAAEYDALKASPTFGIDLFNFNPSYHLDLEADYLNEDDYSAELILKHKKHFTLTLQTERFYHNLDHIPYDGEGSRPDADLPLTATPLYNSPTLGTPKAGDPTERSPESRAFYTDWNPGDRYGLRIDKNEVHLKVKCPDYPAHLNLSYWRYEKKGQRQLRFADESCATSCHMQSRSRDIDRITEEIKGGVDAHVGFFDFAVEALYRTFRDREPVPRDDFGDHSRGRDTSQNPMWHDEDPDSSVRELTFKINTAPSGGLTGSASLTLGERENRSDLDLIAPLKAETDYYKTSADVTYTPNQYWTFNIRHRLLDIDNDNSDFLRAYGSTNPNDLEVREAIDFTRSWYEVSANCRPSSRLTFRAELRREDIDRDQTGPADEHHSSATDPIDVDPFWELPEEEVITTLRVGFHSRMLEKSALKVNGWVQSRWNDDPSYGTSYAESQEYFLSATYAPQGLWGLTASLDLLDEENDERSSEQFDDAAVNQLMRYDLAREKDQQKLTLAAWLKPAGALSFDLNYGYLRTAISQDLLFGAQPNSSIAEIDYTIEDESVDYRQSVQTISAGINWKALERLSGRIEGYHIRSKAHFDPGFATETLSFIEDGYYFPAKASSSDLRQISEVDIRQNGLRGRVDWQINERWQCGFEATFDDYDEVGNDVYDGSAQTYMADLSFVW